MNHSIPIIAIQLNAIKIGNKILLSFTKVLDIYETPEDDENLAGEEVGRPYWEKKSNPKSIVIMDEMIKIAQGKYPNAKVTYNKHHVALGTSRVNFMWFHPRKSPSNCHFEIKLEKDLVAETKTTFDDLGISYTPRKENNLAISIQNDELKKHVDKITTIINQLRHTRDRITAGNSGLAKVAVSFSADSFVVNQSSKGGHYWFRR